MQLTTIDSSASPSGRDIEWDHIAVTTGCSIKAEVVHFLKIFLPHLQLYTNKHWYWKQCWGYSLQSNITLSGQYNPHTGPVARYSDAFQQTSQWRNKLLFHGNCNIVTWCVTFKSKVTQHWSIIKKKVNIGRIVCEADDRSTGLCPTVFIFSLNCSTTVLHTLYIYQKIATCVIWILQ